MESPYRAYRARVISKTHPARRIDRIAHTTQRVEKYGVRRWKTGGRMVEKDDGIPAVELPISLLRAIEEQTTPDLMKRLRKYAQTRVNMLRLAGSSVSATSARELVDDAHADTWVGDLPWDPLQCSLLEHLG